jgi:hypothetical protein
LLILEPNRLTFAVAGRMAWPPNAFGFSKGSGPDSFGCLEIAIFEFNRVAVGILISPDESAFVQPIDRE